MMSYTTTRPDPAINPFEFLNWLGDQIEAIERQRDEVRLTPTAAARQLGYAVGHFSPSRFPWRIPFYCGRGTQHTLAAWRNWLDEKPDKIRRAEWETIPYKDRQRLLGVA
jgi:hypothetical protein